MSDTAGPAWDLTAEYAAPDDPAIDADLAELDGLLAQAERRSEPLAAAVTAAFALAPQEPLPSDNASRPSPSRPITLSNFAETAKSDRLLDAGARSACIAAARDVYLLDERASRLLRDPNVYAECRLSVNSRDGAAQALQGRLQSLHVRYLEAMEPLSQFLDLAPQDWVDEYLADDRVSASEFAVRHSRKRRHETLPLSEETLVNALSQDGIHAWGRLYDQLSGTLRCQVRGEGNEPDEVGLAEAASRMQSTDDAIREDAWRAINRSWDDHVESAAGAINAIAGWRLEMCRRRSGERSVHYLDAPVHANRIERKTLDTLMEVAWEANALGRRAARGMARAYGKTHIAPWDQRAPAPALSGIAEAIPFAEAAELVAEAYGSVNPEMGDFVRMMVDKRWIEATQGANKRPGAYCTSFAKSRAPRVYMTYSGSMTDVTILAHELGHGFHHWVMRDLPDSQRHYGMSVAETASTFGETVVRDALMRRAESAQAELAVAWEEVAATSAFLLNIPTRFEFETRFYDARAERPLLPDELKELMREAWLKWHGDALAEPDPLFWANKLHFYISGLSFYNFPYLFGYLFSLGVYARREQMGESFFERYKALLADTGRMTAEELAMQHLDTDLTAPDFWRDTVAALEPRVANFERLVAECC